MRKVFVILNQSACVLSLHGNENKNKMKKGKYGSYEEPTRKCLLYVVKQQQLGSCFAMCFSVILSKYPFSEWILMQKI